MEQPGTRFPFSYQLGLWCADGYWWSSSVGLTNVEPVLIRRFASWLTEQLGRDRLRLRVYAAEPDNLDPQLLALTDRVSVCRPHKMTRNAYQIYVNSRPLLRRLRIAREDVSELAEGALGPYFAGRFDGDGTINTLRICYTTRSEADLDLALLGRTDIGGTVFEYSRAREFALYVPKRFAGRFLDLIEPWSWKVTAARLPIVRHSDPRTAGRTVPSP